MERTKKSELLSSQMRRRMTTASKDKPEYDGDFGTIINTGSTLLDLNISGGRVRGGGLPGGILVEVFGPSSSGKTVLLSETAGAIQRQGGELIFNDPEARLNKRYAKLFGLELEDKDHLKPNTVPEVFSAVRKWKPTPSGVIHGIFADSLAALSTDEEMDKDKGDKMGMRRAKEFSEECRKTCRILSENNYLMMCSNQVRVNIGGGDWAPKYTTPGGEAIGFYSSLRLQTSITKKIEKEKTINSKEVKRIIGVRINVSVFKSSIWKPFRAAPATIIFDYGIDDIRENLQFIKDHTKNTIYSLGGHQIDKSMDTAISWIEKHQLEQDLKEEVINLWEEVESKFDQERKPKR
jgi:protein RecA